MSENAEPKTMSAVQAIKTYFGVRPDGYQGTEGLPSLLIELRELSPEDKQELAQGAADELGVKLGGTK